MLQVTVQYVIEDVADLPSEDDFKSWVSATLNHFESASHELTIRIIDKDEMQTLNREFRNKDKPTNVLSFHFEPLPDQEINYLGDIAICASVVIDEAKEQNKDLMSHWAHLTIHGVLHLLGYDHEAESDAQEMEGLEVEVMQELGHENPY